MPTWPDDLKIEEARLRTLYKLLHGLLDEDIRDLHIPGDVRTKLKEDLEIKGWNRNGWLPLETHSVLEKQKKGWAWASVKLNVWFVRAEEEEALGIPMEAIRNFLENTGMHRVMELKCTCGRAFMVRIHEHPLLIKQDIQWSNHEEYHQYHSACLFVEPEAFPMRHYLGRPPEISKRAHGVEGKAKLDQQLSYLGPIDFSTPVEPPAATTTAPPKAGGELEQLRINWREVIEQAPEDTKRTPAIAILRSAGTKPVAVEGDTVILAFRYPYHKEVIEKTENRQVAEKIIGNFLGHSCHVRCTYELEGRG